MRKFEPDGSKEFVCACGRVVVMVTVGPSINVANISGVWSTKATNGYVDVSCAVCFLEFVGVHVRLHGLSRCADKGAYANGRFGGLGAGVGEIALPAFGLKIALDAAKFVLVEADFLVGSAMHLPCTGGLSVFAEARAVLGFQQDAMRVVLC